MDDSGLRGARRYREVFDVQIEPWLWKEKNEETRTLFRRFIDDLLMGYVANKIEAPTVSKALIFTMNMSNLSVMELMSDLMDI